MDRDEALKVVESAHEHARRMQNMAGALEEALEVLRDKPEMVSMEKCEDSVRFCKWGADAKYPTAAANYLNVVRNKVVPWLKGKKCDDLLLELGENP